MCIRRFLLALASICISAAPVAAGDSAAQLELRLAKAPALYLRLDVHADALQVMVRGMELERIPVQAVRLVVRRAPGEDAQELSGFLPAVWKVVGDPAIEWRAVVAPPTLVPYDEDAEPPTPVPDADREAPVQIAVGLDNGWRLELGPDPPIGWWRRVADRLGSGWQRLRGKSPVVAPPTLVVVVQPEDSRALLHIIRDGMPLLVVCGESESAAAVEQPAAS
jgi:hypothetical protein